MRVLVDTGVWSLALRRTDGHLHPETEEMRRLVMAHVAEIIGPVRSLSESLCLGQKLKGQEND